MGREKTAVLDPTKPAVEVGACADRNHRVQCQQTGKLCAPCRCATEPPEDVFWVCGG